MCVARLTALLLEGTKDQMETLVLREKEVDQGCQERREILVMWAGLATLVLSVTVE